MKLWKQVKNRLKKHHPTTPLWNNCDEALIGIVEVYREKEWVTVAMYDYEELVNIFHKDFMESQDEEENLDPDNDPHTDAIEWVDYNIVGAYIGKKTPVYFCEQQITGVINLNTKQDYYTQ